MIKRKQVNQTEVKTVTTRRHSTKRPGIVTLFAMVILATGVCAQNVSRPNVPDEIKAPAAEETILMVHASGSQIYVCQSASDKQSTWILKAPDAELHDQQGAIIGHHYGGPSWRNNDGSEVIGKAVAKVDSPDPNSIPWLLVTATGHSGEGVLSRVTSIQRINTKGGMPPPVAECNMAARNVEVKSKYTADYYFYTPPQVALHGGKANR
jgi:hypothetical protein